MGVNDIANAIRDVNSGKVHQVIVGAVLVVVTTLTAAMLSWVASQIYEIKATQSTVLANQKSQSNAIVSMDQRNDSLQSVVMDLRQKLLVFELNSKPMEQVKIKEIISGLEDRVECLESDEC